MKQLCVVLSMIISLGSFGQSENHFHVFGEGEADRHAERNRESESNQSSADAALDGLNDFFEIMDDLDDLYRQSESLSPNECAPDFSTNENAMMPSSCPRAGECAECYRNAMRELNFIRRQLGRLSCIYQNTKNFNTSAIAFGDNASGVHAVTGLAWQYARADIVKAMNDFKGTYDKKYVDMIGSLERALRAVDRCENQFGQQDWFQHSGFIYLEFMKDKYRRND